MRAAPSTPLSGAALVPAVLTLAGLAVAVAGCDGGREAGTSPSTTTAQSSSPTAPATTPAPPGPDAAALEAARARAALGDSVYAVNCAGCHGVEGRGDGVVGKFMRPAPRDFTRGMFAAGSTPYQRLPTDADLARTVREGIRWSAMPPFKDSLTAEEIAAVVEHVKSLTRFEDEDEPGGYYQYFEKRKIRDPIPVPAQPEATPALLARGQELFRGEAAGCAKCHGPNGAGDGPSAKTLKDDWNEPIDPRDLRLPLYEYGQTERDVFLRIRRGLPGTPMPAASRHVSDDDAWAIALYVKSLQTAPTEFVPRGRLLYQAYGCVHCHGAEGRGGVANPNYVKDTIPALNALAERMLLMDAEDTGIIVAALRAGTPVGDNPEVREIMRWQGVVAQLTSIRDVIGNGNPAGKKSPDGPEPPIRQMPAWGKTIAPRDIDAIVAYLLTLQAWPDEQEGDEEEDE